MVVNEILRRSCLSVRIVVESVSGWFWNECPDQPGITVRMLVVWVSPIVQNHENKRLTLENRPGGGGGIQPGRKKSYSTS